MSFHFVNAFSCRIIFSVRFELFVINIVLDSCELKKKLILVFSECNARTILLTLLQQFMNRDNEIFVPIVDVK